ncbi:predicted protein [Thalassiosira pseudonana CCMP1335]|uniref:CHORD domain-containing protein n=1 Tax=Thalassiosira pseudonana TaxID=35128 RepID=B8C9F3_THAPS|nr:predicted protein [Thalassiosira pseudonana CCMP1335]EED90037.1 predicted protein [Thalassiosira pseudonana CCMP1335]
MKVFLRYEENDDESTHKTLKITLPKSWKTGPTSRLLDQFVESYNGGKEGEANPLDASTLHLSIRRPASTTVRTSSASADDGATVLKELPSDGIIVETIEDRDDVYVCHGPSLTSTEMNAERQAKIDKEKEEKKNLSQCVHFGCNNRFPKGGPYPDCKYHSGPPVFHETAKFWSCCPDKKAYDWEGFQCLPTCQSGPKLKSIDDFNASIAAGGSEGAPVLERLRSVLGELGVENELFDQVFEGVKKEVREKNGVDCEDAKVLDEAAQMLGGKLKSAMKAIAVEQLRIS